LPSASAFVALSARKLAASRAEMIVRSEGFCCWGLPPGPSPGLMGMRGNSEAAGARTGGASAGAGRRCCLQHWCAHVRLLPHLWLHSSLRGGSCAPFGPGSSDIMVLLCVRGRVHVWVVVHVAMFSRLIIWRLDEIWRRCVRYEVFRGVSMSQAF
jgi:hypothetical protein